MTATLERDALDLSWAEEVYRAALGLPDPQVLSGWNVTVTDLFCGAGGSSSGAIRVPGVRVRMAANHWKLAIETHNANHEDTDHDCADISQVDPRRYPTTTILWASPECTNHSQAKGVKTRRPDPDLFDEGPLPDEAAERSRATMYDVLRFAEHHKYRAIIVENVVEALKWVGYRGWRQTLEDLGYEVKVVFLNSMHAHQLGLPAPQSRDRIYVVCWRKGERAPDFGKWTRPRALCVEHGEIRAIQAWKDPKKQAGRYRQQYVWRCPSTDCRNAVVEPAWLPAAFAIDWSMPGRRIGDRDKPLSPKTMQRIKAGIEKHWRPIVLEAAGHTFDAATRGGTYFRAWPVDQEHTTLHTSLSKGVAYAESMLVPVEGRTGKQASPASEPLRTQSTRAETGLLAGPLLMRPYTPRNSESGQMLSPVGQVGHTQTASSVAQIVAPPMMVPLRNHGVAKPVEEPIDTVSAGGNHHGLLVPYYGTAREADSTDDTMGTLTAVERYAMVTRQNDEKGNAPGHMSTGVHEALRTLTTAGHQSLTTWFDELPDVDDCLFRMLEPREVKAGMAFEASYVMLGTRREQVKLAGNAVTPPAARDLIAMVVEALTGDVILTS